MDEIAKIIEIALQDLNLDVSRLWNPNPTTDPYIVYSQVAKSPNLFTDNVERSRNFFIDVDIYTTNPSLIDITSTEVEERLKKAGFSLKPSAGTIIENDSEPVWLHEPLEFEYEKEM